MVISLCLVASVYFSRKQNLLKFLGKGYVNKETEFDHGAVGVMISCVLTIISILIGLYYTGRFHREIEELESVWLVIILTIAWPATACCVYYEKYKIKNTTIPNMIFGKGKPKNKKGLDL